MEWNVLNIDRFNIRIYTLLLLLFNLKQSFSTRQSMILKYQNIRDYRERGSHARGVYPTKNTSCMGTAMVKQEEETDTRIMLDSKKSGRKDRGHEREKSQTRPD